MLCKNIRRGEEHAFPARVGVNYIVKDELSVFQTMSTPRNVFKFADTFTESVPRDSETVSLSLYKDGKEVPVKNLPGGVSVRVARVSSRHFMHNFPRYT